ncbi:MAG TPA: glucuronate isomerase [Galbitalea sp.]|jgi:glucuronate isomerase|nr:glucuronate isomerase [Galbitalea sp.]
MRHPDRLLPADPATRDIARRLYEAVSDAPILSPHGHVDARQLASNRPFADPAELFVTPDHYVTRLLHANGVSLDRLRPPTDPREIWREFASRWRLFAGTPVRYWLEDVLEDVFGIDETPSDATADSIYDQLAERLASEEFRPRALFERFGIRVLATTDDPVDDLAAHRALRKDPSFAGHVIPTFRADRYMDLHSLGWNQAIDELSAASGIDCGTYTGMLNGLRARRQFFIENGATSTDTGVADAGAEPLDPVDAEWIHANRLNGTVTADDIAAYRRNLLYRFAEMSTEDGLVMQLHPGVIRNHHRPTFEAYGPDTGHDLPDVASFTRPLQPLLRDFGTHPKLHLVLFTVDETAFSREIAPLAGFYPSVYAGAPWWFLDSPGGIARYRAAVTDTVGFAKTSGFIDDTRAFCSIPARHDVSRRTDAGYLAGLVVTHQLGEDEAARITGELVRDIPAHTFKLDNYLGASSF